MVFVLKKTCRVGEDRAPEDLMHGKGRIPVSGRPQCGNDGDGAVHAQLLLNNNKLIHRLALCGLRVISEICM